MRIGDFELDERAYQLRRSGQPVKIERIPMELLLLLARNRGKLVTRDQVAAHIWGANHYIDSESAINTAVRKLRKVLEPSVDGIQLIETVPAKGYRLIAGNLDVDGFGRQNDGGAVDGSLAGGSSIPAISDEDSATATGVNRSDVATETPSMGAWPSSRLWNWKQLAAFGVVVLLLAGGLLAWRERGRSPSASAPRRVMLAVLPFANLSPDPAQEYFSDGLTEETITDLGELNPGELGVIARTSSATYKRTDKTIAQIGRELGVDYVLEGSVRREGGATRISAQLIRVKDQVHLWAHNYERDTGGILALQNELGRAIAQQVQVKLAPAYGNRSASKYTADPEAYELYLKGRFYLNKKTWPELTESVEYFQRAIEKDPAFALAYSGLASSYLANAIASPQEFDPKAKAAASRALELDDDLAEAHTVLGAVKADFEYDWPGAEQEFKRAVELNPNDADAHQLFAWSYLTPRGESERSIEEMKKALELDPFSRIDNTRFGCIYLYARKYDEALRQFETAIQLNPDFFVTYYHLSWLYSQLDQYPKAITALTKGRLLAYGHRAEIAGSDDAILRKSFAAQGAKGFWQEMLLEEDKDDPEIGEFGRAQVYARLGDKENALRWLQHNYEVRLQLGTLVNVDPAFDSIRDDPRFVELVQRMGLGPKGATP